MSVHRGTFHNRIAWQHALCLPLRHATLQSMVLAQCYLELVARRCAQLLLDTLLESSRACSLHYMSRAAKLFRRRSLPSVRFKCQKVIV